MAKKLQSWRRENHFWTLRPSLTTPLNIPLICILYASGKIRNYRNERHWVTEDQKWLQPHSYKMPKLVCLPKILPGIIIVLYILGQSTKLRPRPLFDIVHSHLHSHKVLQLQTSLPVTQRWRATFYHDRGLNSRYLITL